uniref:Transmembrane protein n=1 Tax=Acrobeloides nanus TaxID=290746 RepID=A0A914E890_9BILA
MEDQACASIILEAPPLTEMNITRKDMTEPTCSEPSSSNSDLYSEEMKNPCKKIIKHAIVFGIIYRLHQWCSKLLWLTVSTVISFYGELKSNNRKTLKEVRKTIVSGKQRKSKTVIQLRIQLFKHLKQLQAVEQYKSHHHHHCHRRKKLSRPPSPQLFDIIEDGSNESVD